MKDRSDREEKYDAFTVHDRLQTMGMSAEEAFHFIGCCFEYHRAFLLIRQYDEREKFPHVFSENRPMYRLKAEKVNLIIREFKSYLAERGENVKNFGVPCNGGVEQIVGNIYLTWDGNELYPEIEDKAVHLFYLLVKDHLFIDGNKRIASFLFLLFLDMNDMLVMGREDRIITYSTVYALAVFVAESNPKDKDIVVQLIRSLVMTHWEALPDISYEDIE